MFYRLIEINETLFYLEQCFPLNLGYACQLNEIYGGALSVRIVYFQSEHLLEVW